MPLAVARLAGRLVFCDWILQKPEGLKSMWYGWIRNCFCDKLVPSSRTKDIELLWAIYWLTCKEQGGGGSRSRRCCLFGIIRPANISGVYVFTEVCRPGHNNINHIKLAGFYCNIVIIFKCKFVYSLSIANLKLTVLMKNPVVVGCFFPGNVADKCKILTFSLQKNQWLNVDSSSIQLIHLWLKWRSAWFDSDSTHIPDFHGRLNSDLTHLIWVRVESNLTHDSWVEHNPGNNSTFTASILIRVCWIACTIIALHVARRLRPRRTSLVGERDGFYRVVPLPSPAAQCGPDRRGQPNALASVGFVPGAKALSAPQSHSLASLVRVTWCFDCSPHGSAGSTGHAEAVVGFTCPQTGRPQVLGSNCWGLYAWHSAPLGPACCYGCFPHFPGQQPPGSLMKHLFSSGDNFWAWGML